MTGKYRQALAKIANEDFLKSSRYSEQQMRADRLKAHPDILLFERKLIRRMAELGVPMFAHCVWRTHEDQLKAYKAGNSKATPENAPHCNGVAVDVIHSTRAWALDENAWKLIGHIGKEIAATNNLPITWGGDWRFYDPAHWELHPWREYAQKR